MHIKTTRFHYISIWMAEIKMTDGTKWWGEIGATKTLINYEDKWKSQSLEIWVSYKVKHTPTIWTSNPSSRKLLRKNENTCLYKDLHSNVHSNFTQKSPNLGKKKQMSINWLRDKQCHMSITKNIQQTKTNHWIDKESQKHYSNKTQSLLFAWFHLHKILKVSKLWGQKAETGKVAGVGME